MEEYIVLRADFLKEFEASGILAGMLGDEKKLDAYLEIAEMINKYTVDGSGGANNG